MRAKSEYPTRHADQHSPDGSDALLRAIWYRFLNIGAWLYVRTSSFFDITSYFNNFTEAGQAFTTDTRNILFTTHAPGGTGGEIGLVAGTGWLGYLAGESDVVYTEGGDFKRYAAGGTILLDAGTGTVDLDADSDVTIVSSSGTIILEGVTAVQLGVGQTFTLKDHLGAAKIQWTEGTTVLHIPTGGTIVADL